ncbi:MAG: peptidoglycan-binding protein [Defluviitaleaceae bacterium]|nr:peptidoglycan-binding protein [Defluviitaleaceae bacterium]
MEDNMANSGGLTVTCFARGRAVPINGARVTIFGENGGDDAIFLGEMITDVSGRTSEIELRTPPHEFSFEPGSPMPYERYNVHVEAEGFAPLTVRDVQVLPDTHAIQECELHHSMEDREEIIILPHTLYGDFPEREPEDPVKPLPQPTGYVVLDNVVVPEFIIVHDGRPNVWARRHTVPYRDYIKNVTSSEIYANWPVECLKANILAINSFTLNRVFTEWYRGQGKDFTITSSTTVDQAYVHGRNIFEEIGHLVDELFTTYITKPDIRQPLLAQYNDGVRSNNPGWLSQWGSKRLAEQGYDALSILRHYFGGDVYLQNAPQVAGVPSSFPNFNLTVGSSGDAVRTIQYQLNRIADNYPALPKVAVDGVFGEATAESVRTFQRIFNMTADGIVGFATWYRISHIFVAVTRMAEVN